MSMKIFVLLLIALSLFGCYNLYDMGSIDPSTNRFFIHQEGSGEDIYYRTDPIKIIGYPPYDDMRLYLFYNVKNRYTDSHYSLYFKVNADYWYFIDQIRMTINGKLYFLNDPEPDRYMSGSRCHEDYLVSINDSTFITELEQATDVQVEYRGSQRGSVNLGSREIKQIKDFIFDTKRF